MYQDTNYQDTDMHQDTNYQDTDMHQDTNYQDTDIYQDMERIPEHILPRTNAGGD
jgi:hypothetical protein